MRTPEHIQALLVRQVWNDLSPQEEAELLAWRSSSPGNEAFFRKATDRKALFTGIERMRAEEDGILGRVLARYQPENRPPEFDHPRIYRILRIAAMLVISVGCAIYFLSQDLDNSKPRPPVKGATAGDHAVFVDADGIATMLSETEQGYREGREKGRLMRNNGIPVFSAAADPHAADGKYNTLRTLKGGKICLQLPDGTRAWLNGLSSVSYPANYSVDSGRISIEGEVYVELTENKSVFTPFRVRLRSLQFEVTTGRFDARAYAGDSVIITAIDGDLRLDTGSAPSSSVLLLHPPEQAEIVRGRVNVRKDVDLLKLIGWKNAPGRP